MRCFRQPNPNAAEITVIALTFDLTAAECIQVILKAAVRFYFPPDGRSESFGRFHADGLMERCS